MHELCKDVKYWLEETSDLTFLQQSARIHFRLAQIHPFENGNGRHARLISDLYLQSLHGKKPHWPEQILQANSNARKEYIDSLRKADRGEYFYLENLIVKYGGTNPTIAQILTLPFFKQNLSQKKLEETVQNLQKNGQ